MKSWPKIKLGQVQVSLNIAQNHSSNPYEVIPAHYLSQFTWKVEPKVKLDDSAFFRTQSYITEICYSEYLWSFGFSVVWCVFPLDFCAKIILFALGTPFGLSIYQYPLIINRIWLFINGIRGFRWCWIHWWYFKRDRKWVLLTSGYRQGLWDLLSSRQTAQNSWPAVAVTID